jgi:hypothetical protein
MSIEFSQIPGCVNLSIGYNLSLSQDAIDTLTEIFWLLYFLKSAHYQTSQLDFSAVDRLN